MKHNFKVGDKVMVVGTNSGCGRTKCKDCPVFIGKVLLITHIESKGDYFERERTIHAGYGNIPHRHSCSFNPLDLKLARIENWRDRIK